jgi:hypothetical protein
LEYHKERDKIGHDAALHVSTLSLVLITIVNEVFCATGEPIA